MTTQPRPKWVKAIYDFIGDEVIDEKYDYPMQGEDDSLHEEIEDAVNQILCRRYGHEIIDDMCRIPDHRYCVWCGKSIISITF